MKSRQTHQLFVVAALAFFFFGVALVGPGLSAEKKDSGCRYEIPIEKAASILGVAAGDVTLRSFKQPVSPEDRKNRIYQVSPCSYHYRSKSDFLKSISYTVYGYIRSEKARSAFNTMRSNFKTVAKVKTVPGLGDAAFWVNDKRFHRLVVLRDKVMIDMVNPKKLELQKRAVRLLFKK